MGCSGYEQMAMETDNKAYNQKVIALFSRVMIALAIAGIKESAKLDKEDPTKSLCEVMKKLTNKQIEKLLNTQSNHDLARDLADWWNRHQSLDAERERKEKEEKRIHGLRKSALKKLTKAERQALGL